MKEGQKGSFSMERIMVMGCSGSGKSTLAQNLSKELGVDAIHLDSHFFVANWTPVPRDQFQKAIEECLKKDKWVMDGNFQRTLIDERIKRADTIIHLDFSTWNCLYGIIKRRIQYHGKTRPDGAENSQERIDLNLLKWVWNYNRDYHPELKKLLAESKGKRIIVLKNRWEVDDFVEEVKKSVKENRPVNWKEN